MYMCVYVCVYVCVCVCVCVYETVIRGGDRPECSVEVCADEHGATSGVRRGPCVCVCVCVCVRGRVRICASVRV
jgi:hypothetical protein